MKEEIFNYLDYTWTSFFYMHYLSEIQFNGRKSIFVEIDKEREGGKNDKFEEVIVSGWSVVLNEGKKVTNKAKFPAGRGHRWEILIGTIRLKRIISTWTIEGLIAGREYGL